MTRSWWLLLPFFCDKQPFQKGHLCTVSLLGYYYTCISVYHHYKFFGMCIKNSIVSFVTKMCTISLFKLQSLGKKVLIFQQEERKGILLNSRRFCSTFKNLQLSQHCVKRNMHYFSQVWRQITKSRGERI